MDLSLLLSLHVFVAVATWQLAGGVTNLLANPGFEEDLKENWKNNGFTMVRHTEDSFEGDYSIKCYERYSPSRNL